MPRRRRNIPLYVMVSPEELEQLHGTLNLSLFPLKARFCPSYIKKTTLYKLRAKLARSSRTEKKQGSEGLAPAPHAYSSTMADSCFSMSFMRPHSSA